MDHVVGVQVSQTLKGPVRHSRDLHLLKGLLVHWGVREKHQTEGSPRVGMEQAPFPYTFFALLPSPTCWPEPLTF